MPRKHTKAVAPAGRWAGLPTERRNPRSRQLDTLTTPQVVRLLLEKDGRAVAAAPTRTRAVDRDDRGRREGRRLRPGDVLVAISASSVTPFKARLTT